MTANHTISATFVQQTSGNVYEAENATLNSPAKKNTNHNGYSGTGFVDGFYNTTGGAVTFNVNVAAAGSYRLTLRYSAGNGTCTNMGLYVGATKIKNLSFNATSNWDTWADQNETVTLAAGSNQIIYRGESSSNRCINLDKLTLASLVSYTVTFDKNDAAATGAMGPQSMISGTTANLISCTFTKAGSVFTGWATSTTGAVVYANGASFTMGTADVTLYAKWVSNCTPPVLPPPSGLTTVTAKLPDPFRFYNGTALTSRADWPCRRKEILEMAGKYLYGPMPPDPDAISGTISGNTISAIVTVGSNTQSLSWSMSGSGDILCIKIASAGINPSGARVLSLNHNASPIANLYGYTDITGSISCAWRAKIICAVIDQNPAGGINPGKIMVTGCSGAATVAMVTGAYCEGIDLTLISESTGGGAGSLRMAEWFRHGDGAAIWRCADGGPQGIDNIEDNGIAGPWVAQAANWMRSTPSKVKNLPFDQHLVLACIAPRACCFVTNQNGIDEWCHLGSTCSALSAWAAEPVWNALGVPANFGFLIYTESSAPSHCSNPASATTLANRFFDRVFNGNTSAATDVLTIPSGDVQQPVSEWNAMWVDWNMNTILN